MMDMAAFTLSPGTRLEQRKKCWKEEGSAQHQRQRGASSEAEVPNLAIRLQQLCLHLDAIPFVGSTTEGKFDKNR